jgi:hypothetical protein
MKHVQTPSMTIFARDGCVLETEALVEVTLTTVVKCWTLRREGMITLVLHRPRMLTHHVTPRHVAEALGPSVSYTTELASGLWEVWFSAGKTHSSPLDIRDQVRALLKTNVLVVGIRGITDFYVTQDPSSRPCLVTRGSNLCAVCQLPWVDLARTTTNDLMELYIEYGIDAMCVSIEQNLMRVMVSNSASVSRPHLHLIAHEMCRTGSPCPLTFVGMQTSRTSTLKLATFERCLETFVCAARTGHENHLRGVSESVIVGKPVSLGTGGDFSVVSVTGTTVKEHVPVCIYPPTPCDVTIYPDLPTIRPLVATRKRPHPQPMKEPISQKHVKRDVETPNFDGNPFMNHESKFVQYRLSSPGT